LPLLQRTNETLERLLEALEQRFGQDRSNEVITDRLRLLHAPHDEQRATAAFVLSP